jgi:hypothetical protein
MTEKKKEEKAKKPEKKKVDEPEVGTMGVPEGDENPGPKPPPIR